MISHVSLGVADLERARLFYGEALRALGLACLWSNPAGAGFGPAGADDCLALFARESSTAGDGLHVAFEAQDCAAVDAFFASALRCGGRDAGAPALRPAYGAGYYAAFVLDPDGHKLEAVCHKKGGKDD